MEAVVAVAVAAAERILEFYEGEIPVQRKGDESPVTPADMAAHELILEGLGRLEPGLPILSEEGPIPGFAERSRWESYWLVDPLDGTRGFIAGRGEFTVNIALVSANLPVLGVIAVPVRGTCYYAYRGAGARLRDADGGSVSIRSRARPRAQVAVLRSRTRRHPRVDHLIGRLGAARVVSAGSSLKACLVAQGLADLYLSMGSTSEWDTAAAQCLVEEAGGGLTDFRLQALRYNTRASLENPPFLAFGDPGEDWRALLAD